jgi:NAD(P)-dependent dehydrogenase (short-subunit alcohol dehydrogenase family)
VSTEDGIARVRDALGDGAVPDIVVHAAGAFELAPLAQTSVTSFDRMVAVNLRAAFLLIRTFVPGMLERGTGHIVTIGSVAGRNAFPSNGAYSASKFGVRGLCAVLAAELRGTGVRATFVEPAATDTPLWDAVDMAGSPGLPPRSAMLGSRCGRGRRAVCAHPAWCRGDTQHPSGTGVTMFVVTVQAHYDSAHYLRNYKGKCERLHGHRYVVELALGTTELDKAGIAFDFVEVKKHLRALADHLDHNKPE